jgi:muramoyltetrapeptide carboxypeptidase
MGEKIEEPLPLVVAQSRMADLANLGVFDVISGLVVGRPYGFDDKGRGKFIQMVADQCYDTDYPIILNVDVWRSDPILKLPLDALCGLDSEKDELSILEAGAVLGESWGWISNPQCPCPTIASMSQI